MKQSVNPLLNALSNLINSSPKAKRFLNAIGLGGALLAAIGLIGKYLVHTESLTVLLIVGFGILCTFLFLSAFITTETDTPMLTFGRKLLFWGLSVLLVGVLFGIMLWAGADKMLRVGGGCTLIGLLVFVYALRKAQDQADNR